eukprot:3431-Heterococcus_DN1.PRE.1
MIHGSDFGVAKLRAPNEPHMANEAGSPGASILRCRMRMFVETLTGMVIILHSSPLTRPTTPSERASPLASSV